MATKDTKLSHHDEYEVVRDEITLYQQEMHRTWLWAIIPAGAVYTWLASHKPEPSAPLPPAVWFIPVIFVLLCGIRYLVFSCRINQLAEYQCELEEDAFGKGGKLPGIASRNRQGFLPMISVIGACLVWGGLLASAVYLSCTLSQMKPMPLIRGACLIWAGLVVYPIYLSRMLSQKKPNHSDPAEAIAPPAPVSSLVPVQAAPLPLLASRVSPSAASSPATSQPAHIP
jgi:hypothetical protein